MRVVGRRSNSAAVYEMPSFSAVSSLFACCCMLSRVILRLSAAHRRLLSSSQTVPFAHTQALVPTLPVPPLEQTIAKFNRLTRAILQESQVEVRCMSSNLPALFLSLPLHLLLPPLSFASFPASLSASSTASPCTCHCVAPSPPPPHPSAYQKHQDAEAAATKFMRVSPPHPLHVPMF